MFTLNEDLSIYATRGDIVFFSVAADDNGKPYTFKAGDVVRIKIYGKKDVESVVLQKDFPVTEDSTNVEIFLTEEDTKIGEAISKPKDYWYEVELNPYNNPQTIIGYDDNGAKVFKLFPEGDDVPEWTPAPEDISAMDDELDMTSTKPVQNQAIARAVTSLRADFEEAKEYITNKSNDTAEVVAATERAVSVERARIDNLVSGATAGDEELVDIRVGDKGETYASAGASVRSQLSDLKYGIECGYNPKNLIDPKRNYIWDKFVDTTGTVQNRVGMCCAKFYVTPGTNIYSYVPGDYHPRSTAVFFAFFGADGSLVSVVNPTIKLGLFGTTPVPDGASYCMVDIVLLNTDYSGKLFVSTEPITLQTIINKTTENGGYTGHITREDSFALGNVKGVVTNLYNPFSHLCGMTDAYIPSLRDGLTERYINLDSTIRAKVAMIPVTPGENYLIFDSQNVMGSYTGFLFVDGENNLIESKAWSECATRYEDGFYVSVTAPAGSEYVVLNTELYSRSFREDHTATLVMCSGDKMTPEIWTNYATHINGSRLPVPNGGDHYQGKRWAVFGDSLTEKNYRAEMSYYDYIRDELGVSIVNYGVSGSGYKRAYDTGNDFAARMLNVDSSEFDVLTIFGSGNDNNTNLPIGNIADTGTSTLCGCINTTIDNFYSVAPTKPIGLVTPCPWAGFPPSAENNWMEQYSNAIVAIARSRGIPCLDLYHSSGMRPWDASFRESFYVENGIVDAGVHPNSEGHRVFLYPRFREFLKSLL